VSARVEEAARRFQPEPCQAGWGRRARIAPWVITNASCQGARHRAEPADCGGERSADGVEHVPERAARRRQRGGFGIEGVHGHGGVDPDRLAVGPGPAEPPAHGGRRQLDQLGDPAVAEARRRRHERRSDDLGGQAVSGSSGRGRSRGCPHTGGTGTVGGCWPRFGPSRDGGPVDGRGPTDRAGRSSPGSGVRERPRPTASPLSWGRGSAA